MITGGVGCWRLIWMLRFAILFCPVLSSSPHDFTFVHLSNYLNHSVSPCSDFHKHVCSIAMNREDTAVHKSEQYFEDIADMLNWRSRNNPIMNDISAAREVQSCAFNTQLYTAGLRKRCGSLFNCYLEEFYYFFNLYGVRGHAIDETLSFFASHANITKKNIPKILSVTSKMIGYMMLYVDDSHFDSAVTPYQNLHKRLSIMSQYEQYGTEIMEQFYGLDRIRNSIILLKEEIANRFMETTWLTETDAVGLDRLSQFQTTLEELRIIADFDQFDANLTMWRRIDRIITTKYFEYNKRSTGCARFDVMHPFLTIQNEINMDEEPGVTPINFKKMVEGLVHNAFNFVYLNEITVFAPNFYPFMWANSSETTQLGFTASILGHEIFHSFIKLSNTNEVFQHEAGCMMKHFDSCCKKWAEGACNSGQQTLEEDAPDLEGLRATYQLLRNAFNEDQLKETEDESLGVTREQAFFYAYGVHHCHANGDHNLQKHTDEHSASAIRLNGALALMPEFTAAFGCKKEDEEYSEESTSCYLFGPLAGAKRADAPSEEKEEEITANPSI